MYLTWARNIAIPILGIILFLLYVPFILLGIYAGRIKRDNPKRRRRLLLSLGIPDEQKIIAGFFHPYCNAGGGGERVLWTAIAYLQRTDPSVISIVYTGDTDATKEDIIIKVKHRFGIHLNPHSLSFVYLTSRYLVEDSSWPRFTLLGQSIGSMWLAQQALIQIVPDVFFDTMGYAFTFPVVRALAGNSIPIVAYIHYPTISSSMLRRVSSREAGYNNASAISHSPLLSLLKLTYYRIFAHLYTQSLRSSTTTLLANSSWTKNHIDSLLLEPALPTSPFPLFLSAMSLLVDGLLTGGRRTALQEPPQHFTVVGGGSGNLSADIVYPPCDTTSLDSFPLTGRETIILSIAQFRPEKDHPTQLYALATLFKAHPEYKTTVKLVLIGSCRNDHDAQRVDNLRKLANQLDIKDNVEFILNAPYHRLQSWLSRSSIGINTMVEEHFGIGVVEYMAAGLIPVVHASGGPLNDIVTPIEGEPTGFHARDKVEFAEALHTALSLTAQQDLAIRTLARQKSQQFSVEGFEFGFQRVWERINRQQDRSR